MVRYISVPIVQSHHLPHCRAYQCSFHLCVPHMCCTRTSSLVCVVCCSHGCTAHRCTSYYLPLRHSLPSTHYALHRSKRVVSSMMSGSRYVLELSTRQRLFILPLPLMQMKAHMKIETPNVMIWVRVPHVMMSWPCNTLLLHWTHSHILICLTSHSFTP